MSTPIRHHDHRVALTHRASPVAKRHSERRILTARGWRRISTLTKEAEVSRALGESFTTLCHAAGLTH